MIKFRAWNKQTHKMSDWSQIKELYNWNVFDQVVVVLQQYTGFKHKGVEIYDKDILRFTNPAPGKKWRKNHGEVDYNDMVVSWNKQRGQWAVYWQNKTGELCFASLHKSLTENHIIVGNAYQNADLVK